METYEELFVVEIDGELVQVDDGAICDMMRQGMDISDIAAAFMVEESFVKETILNAAR